MILTLWLSVLLFASCAPGAFISLFGSWGKKHAMYAYTIVMLVVVTVISVTLLKFDALALVCVAAVVFVLYLGEILGNLWGKRRSLRGWRQMIDLGPVKELLFPLVLIPVSEEFCFRWAVFAVGASLGIATIPLVILSVISFVIAHFFTQGLVGLWKMFIAIAAVALFMTWGIWAAIAMHMLFNLVVFLRKLSDSTNLNFRRLYQ